jgi:hypothetical protein
MFKQERRDAFTGAVGSALDFGSDWAVLSFAAWTLIAYAGMLTGAAATLLVTLWLLAVPLAGAGLAAARRRSDSPPEDSAESRPDTTPLYAGLAAASIASGLLGATLIALGRRVAWPVAWVPAAIAVALAVALGCLHRGSARDAARLAHRGLAHVIVAVTGVAFAAISLLIKNTDADDAFYVNRATATAQLNRIPVKDVLFTDERVAPISGAGLPVDTLHPLQGAVGRVAGIHAASVAYLVTPPVAAFLATWTLWRLVRAWTPRWAPASFALACVYWLWSAELHMNPGSFFLGRIWQGKVIFVAWLIPATYVLLTRWIGRQDRVTAVLLLAAAIAGIGLTASASFVAPLVFATGGLVLLCRRKWRALALLVVAAAIPFAIGFGATRHYPVVHGFAGALHGDHWFVRSIFGVGVVAAVGIAAVLLGPWLARAGAPANIATGVAVVAVVLLAPGALAVLSDASDLTDTLRRTLWVVPIPPLVGLLAAVRWRGMPAVVPALTAAGLLLAFGQPLWESERGGSYWTSRPIWKTNTARTGEARAILQRYHDPGAILAKESVMLAIAIETAQPKTVNPRTYYARLLPEPRRRLRQRLLLTRFARTGEGGPPARVRQALSDLGVGLICVDADIADSVRAMGLDAAFHPSFRVGGLLCLRRGAVTRDRSG